MENKTELYRKQLIDETMEISLDRLERLSYVALGLYIRLRSLQNTPTDTDYKRDDWDLLSILREQETSEAFSELITGGHVSVNMTFKK